MRFRSPHGSIVRAPAKRSVPRALALPLLLTAVVALQAAAPRPAAAKAAFYAPTTGHALAEPFLSEWV
jgi:hypothetical protein